MKQKPKFFYFFFFFLFFSPFMLELISQVCCTWFVRQFSFRRILQTISIQIKTKQTKMTKWWRMNREKQKMIWNEVEQEENATRNKALKSYDGRSKIENSIKKRNILKIKWNEESTQKHTHTHIHIEYIYCNEWWKNCWFRVFFSVSIFFVVILCFV